MVWQCDSRIVLDDNTQPGRVGVPELVQRTNNYAFEGEQIQWRVLVLDKNGIDKVSDVFMTIGSSQGAGNDIEANCILSEILRDADQIEDSCNARIGQADLEDVFQNHTAAYYDCIFTVETPLSMYGEYWITVEALDIDGLSGTMNENEYWFLNPVVALAVDGNLAFDNVRPGTSVYSSTILVENDADIGSGVMLDMFISGTDFYDSSSSGARCPTTNQLSLDAFRYYVVNGAYGSRGDARSDDAGYLPIGYGIGFNNPNQFYGAYEILQEAPMVVSGATYYMANILAPGAEMALTFRLDLPEPCNGDFDTGSIYFWGEAI
ncbi:MAG: hypothetical protein ACMXYG_04685 [Candidatus Woesearchaeota archaeon]